MERHSIFWSTKDNLQFFTRTKKISFSDKRVAAAPETTAEEMLSRIFHFRCHDYLDLMALVHLLPEFIQQNPSVKLIVVDSVATHFRYAFGNEALGRRAKIISSFMQKLNSVAIENHIAVRIVVYSIQNLSSLSMGREEYLKRK